MLLLKKIIWIPMFFSRTSLSYRRPYVSSPVMLPTYSVSRPATYTAHDHMILVCSRKCHNHDPAHDNEDHDDTSPEDVGGSLWSFSCSWCGSLWSSHRRSSWSSSQSTYDRSPRSADHYDPLPLDVYQHDPPPEEIIMTLTPGALGDVDEHVDVVLISAHVFVLDKPLDLLLQKDNFFSGNENKYSLKTN